MTSESLKMFNSSEQAMEVCKENGIPFEGIMQLPMLGTEKVYAIGYDKEKQNVIFRIAAEEEGGSQPAFMFSVANMFDMTEVGLFKPYYKKSNYTPEEALAKANEVGMPFALEVRGENLMHLIENGITESSTMRLVAYNGDHDYAVYQVEQGNQCSNVVLNRSALAEDLLAGKFDDVS